MSSIGGIGGGASAGSAQVMKQIEKLNGLLQVASDAQTDQALKLTKVAVETGLQIQKQATVDNALDKYV